MDKITGFSLRETRYYDIMISVGTHNKKVENAVIYPIECFNPYDDPTGRLYKTKQTYSIHWYAKSWMDKKTVMRSKLTKPLHRVLKFFGRSAK